MRDFLIVVVVGTLFGGLGSFALLPELLERTTEWELGGMKIPIQDRAKDFTRNELLLGIFLASLFASLLAFVASMGFARMQKRRR